MKKYTLILPMLYALTTAPSFSLNQLMLSPHSDSFVQMPMIEITEKDPENVQIKKAMSHGSVEIARPAGLISQMIFFC